MLSEPEYFHKLRQLRFERKTMVEKSSYHLKPGNAAEAREIMTSAKRVKAIDIEIDGLKRDQFTLLYGGKHEV